MKKAKRIPIQPRSNGGNMGWQMPPLDNRMPVFAIPRDFFAIFNCCLIFADKGRYPEIFVCLNLGLCDILERSIFSCIHIAHLLVITSSMDDFSGLVLCDSSSTILPPLKHRPSYGFGSNNMSKILSLEIISISMLQEQP